jgi:DNA-binding transcriptional regulator of glucitol operon
MAEKKHLQDIIFIFIIWLVAIALVWLAILKFKIFFH